MSAVTSLMVSFGIPCYIYVVDRSLFVANLGQMERGEGERERKREERSGKWHTLVEVECLWYAGKRIEQDTTTQKIQRTCFTLSFSKVLAHTHAYAKYFSLISNLANHDMSGRWKPCTTHMLVVGWGGSMRVCMRKWGILHTPKKLISRSVTSQYKKYTLVHRRGG